MESSRDPEIVFCYAHEDYLAVDSIYQKLKDAGYKPWMDKRDLLPGQNWKTLIPKALRTAKYAIVFLSKYSASKEGYQQHEFQVVLDALQEVPENHIYLIPVRLNRCIIPEEFKHIHYCDLFEKDGIELLFRTLENDRAA